MEYELKRHGITIPFDAIAKRLASEKDTTGPCVQQHLAKLRKEMLARGSWVPPLSGKPNTKQPQSDIRGIVKVKNENGEYEVREISWTEDAFKYVDLVHINQVKTFKGNKFFDNGEVNSGSARRLLKNKGSSAYGTEDGVDPADLSSDEEFDPSSKKSHKAKRVARASAKFGGRSNGNSYGGESDADSESESGGIAKRKVSRKPAMMALYQSEEEQEVFTGQVIFRLAGYLLSEYPAGINEAYRNTHAIKIGTTDENGEEVFGDDASDSDSHHPANTAQNYAEAFAHGLGYSVMDANTAENYAAAFGGREDYSIMDANTAVNYAAAFGGGNEGNFGRGNADNHDVDDSDSDDSDSDFGDQQVAMANVNPHMVQSSHQLASFGNTFQNDNAFGPALHNTQGSQRSHSSVFNQVSNQQTGYGNFMEMINSASTSVQNSSSQTAYGHNAVGQNTMGHNGLGQNYFHSDARSQDVLMGGPVNRAPTGDSYGGKTFAQIITERNALSGGSGSGSGYSSSMSNGFVVGDTNNAANDPFVSTDSGFDNQIVGIQTGAGNNPSLPAIAVEDNLNDQNDTDHPMDGFGNSGNDENRTPDAYDAQSPFQDYIGDFDVSGQLPPPGSSWLMRRSTTSTMIQTSDMADFD